MRFHHNYESSVETYQWNWKHLPFMLRSTELNTFGMINISYRDLMYRANGVIYRLMPLICCQKCRRHSDALGTGKRCKQWPLHSFSTTVRFVFNSNWRA